MEDGGWLIVARKHVRPSAPYLASIFSASAVNTIPLRKGLPEAEMTYLFGRRAYRLLSGPSKFIRIGSLHIRPFAHSCVHFRRKRSLFEKIIRRYHVTGAAGAATAAFQMRRILRAPLLLLPRPGVLTVQPPPVRWSYLSKSDPVPSNFH